MDVQNSLGALRTRRGLSAAEVAQAIGVSRQTIYAIEAGSYVPNTAVALKLAQLFEAKVEDIFILQAAAPDSVELSRATLLAGDDTSNGNFVQLCQVDDRLIAVRPSLSPWTIPASDAMLCSEPQDGSKEVQIRAFVAPAEYSKRLLIAGCDPAISIVVRHVQKGGVEAVVVGRNSSQSLQLLRDGFVHVAGTHLAEAEGETNHATIYRQFAPGEVAVFSYAVWEQGLVVARGNPKAVLGIADLGRPEIRFVNRESGAGSRVLLDKQLINFDISASAVQGYTDVVYGHLAAAGKVNAGDADACMATKAAARFYGLDFIPIVRERYDFVIHTKHLELPAVQTLLATLGRISLRRELHEIGGYDMSNSGERLE